VASASSGQSSRQRVRLELWSWSTWLVLCIISYPAVVMIWNAPRAGVLAGFAAGALLLVGATLGYAGRRELDGWLLPLASSVGIGALAAALAFAADRASPGISALCGLTAACEVAFVWHFLPWIVRDADISSVATSPSLQLLRRGLHTRGTAPVRASLSLGLLLAFLMLGLGASWSRGESRVPSPTVWLMVLAVLALALMFVERMSFFERSSREGNLLMPAGSYVRWAAAGMAVLCLAALVAAVLPWRPARQPTEASTVGSASIGARPAPQQETGLRKVGSQAISAVGQLVARALSMPRAVLALWLLLLLLLAALILMWGFRRSRAAQRLLWLLGWAFSHAVRAWRCIASAVRRLVRGDGKRGEAGAGAAEEGPAHPLLDLFEDPEALAGLSAREIVIRTYHLLLNFAEMLGHGRAPGQTPFEYARRLEEEAPQAGESVLGLTWAYSGAMYGGEDFAPPAPPAVRRTWEHISKALTENVSPEDLALRRRAYLAARALEGRS